MSSSADAPSGIHATTGAQPMVGAKATVGGGGQLRTEFAASPFTGVKDRTRFEHPPGTLWNDNPKL